MNKSQLPGRQESAYHILPFHISGLYLKLSFQRPIKQRSPPVNDFLQSIRTMFSFNRLFRGEAKSIISRQTFCRCEFILSKYSWVLPYLLLKTGHMVMLLCVKTDSSLLLSMCIQWKKEMLMVIEILQWLFIWCQLHLAAFGYCE